MLAHIEISQITPFLPPTLVPLLCIQYVYSFQLINVIVFITTFTNAAVTDTAETKQGVNRTKNDAEYFQAYKLASGYRYLLLDE